MKSKLTPEEVTFVEEAEAGYFIVEYDEAGRPYARGASSTGNLFTGDVEETPDRYEGGSVYQLRY